MMMQRILLPIDGSMLSERAVDMAVALAEAQGAELILVCAVEPPRWLAMDADGAMGAYDYVTPDVYEQVEAALNEDARAALVELTDRLSGRGLRLRSKVLHGFAANELLFFEEQEQPDLVVMASHGRTGLARFALGSVADRLVREGTSPVLIVKSFQPVISTPERALVPLDGSQTAEEALLMVEILAGKPLRSVRLLRAVDRNVEVLEARDYLAEVADRVSSEALEVIPVVRVGRPVDAIEAEAQGVDLVIMATHGLGGFDRFRHGSVAEQAARHLGAPVLLIRAGGPAPVQPGPVAATAGASNTSQ